MPLSKIDLKLHKNNFYPINKKLSKIAVIGDSGVGKTSLIKRITTNTFDTNYNMTIGGDFSTKKLPLKNGQYCTYIFSDVSGQSRFKETRQVFYTAVDLVIAVCDITRKQSLTNLEKLWIPEFLSSYPIQEGNNLKIQIICNKSDLVDYSVLNPSDLERVASRISIKYPQVTIVDPCIITSSKYDFYEPNSSKRHNKAVLVQC